MNYLKQINQQDWVLHLEPAIDTPLEVIRYIGRYSKRACLSEYKITNMEGDYITFRYKDYRDRDENKKPKEKELCLHYRDFFPRLLQHVPAKYFRIVRYYGLYSNHGNIPEEYFYNEEEKTEGQEIDLSYCEHCKIRKVLVGIYFDTRTRKERTAFETRKYKKKEAA
jgi:SMC interacting uncharacterized protein involved in chromosome segregation